MLARDVIEDRKSFERRSRYCGRDNGGACPAQDLGPIARQSPRRLQPRLEARRQAEYAVEIARSVPRGHHRRIVCIPHCREEVILVRQRKSSYRLARTRVNSLGARGSSWSAGESQPQPIAVHTPRASAGRSFVVEQPLRSTDRALATGSGQEIGVQSQPPQQMLGFLTTHPQLALQVGRV